MAYKTGSSLVNFSGNTMSFKYTIGCPLIVAFALIEVNIDIRLQ